MTGFVINVDHWPNSKFVTVSGYGKHMRPDTFFCQYTIGKMKPNYPMPAIRYQIAITRKGIAVINLSENTIDSVITERNHIVYDH